MNPMHTSDARQIPHLHAAILACWCAGSGKVGPREDEYVCPCCQDLRAAIAKRRRAQLTKALDDAGVDRRREIGPDTYEDTLTGYRWTEGCTMWPDESPATQPNDAPHTKAQ